MERNLTRLRFYENSTYLKLYQHFGFFIVGFVFSSGVGSFLLLTYEIHQTSRLRDLALI